MDAYLRRVHGRCTGLTRTQSLAGVDETPGLLGQVLCIELRLIAEGGVESQRTGVVYLSEVVVRH